MEWWFLCVLLLFLLVTWCFSLRIEETSQMRLDSKAWFDGLFPSIGCYLGAIKVLN